MTSDDTTGFDKIDINTQIMQNQGFLGPLANSLGATEPALKLLISLLFGYPLAAIYHSHIKKHSLNIKNIYFALTGFLICCFNYGYDVYHSLISILITYILCRYFCKYRYFVIINFIFNMGYLLIGYYFTESNDYDIKWTMPHCVLVLRLIGYGFDISDGKTSKDKLSKDQLENAIYDMPNLLQLTSFTYFPASFLVGPQFQYQRYKNFINGKFDNYKGNIEAGLKRGSIGILYLIIRQIGATFIPDSFIMSEEFDILSLPTKILYIGIWGKLSLYKYVSCWLITEGALIYFGLTYVNTDKNTGISDWSGCSNINIRIFELATKMEHYVKSFNINTNQWVASYVYKRLKFLNNRTISYASALLFLAMWHGFHSGYYMSFLLEYSVITFEKQFESLWSKYILAKYSNIINSNICEVLIFIIMKIYNTSCMGWCMVPFVYLNYTRWFYIYSKLYYYGYIFLISWFIFNFYMKKYVTKPKKNDKSLDKNKSQ
ncbi:lysophospholipid acyltransferase 5 [Condylostylus longicornis]|uniref:lysophospholipid acyltransferase 5 n=1 Tax=Condylostylus longicornis TaxID=2530218 RepID=UPI00244DF9EF|nr:lysophospholipid acyltransferase 5 [Condylostylus longicornis]